MWRIAIITKSDCILDLMITRIPYEEHYEREISEYSPGGGFDTVVYRVLKMSSKLEFYKVISLLYKKQDNMSIDAKRAIKPFIKRAANAIPEAFV